ncbi:hypothetical protein JTB14_025282 [Gonioctena quinquepunctata]|nr:hypothetical protein JTB14_025282 [Gonioctena quinquepunctata]
MYNVIKLMQKPKNYSIVKQDATGENGYPNSIETPQANTYGAKLIQRIRVNTKKSINNGWQEEFLDNIAPSYVPEMMTIPHSEIDEPSSFLGQPFTLRELELAMKKSSDTAPGFDDITYSMISHLPVVAKIYLLNIFNDIWVRNADCQYRKTVNVIPILKIDKCPNPASSYRPISLFSCLFKTFERMIKAGLEWHLKMFNILPTYQFCFKTGYGTLDAVATLVTDIQASLTKNNYCGAVFMDIKGANWVDANGFSISESSIYSAEAYAILMALAHILSQNEHTSPT